MTLLDPTPRKRGKPARRQKPRTRELVAHVSLRLPQSTCDALAALAREESRRISAMARVLIEQGLIRRAAEERRA